VRIDGNWEVWRLAVLEVLTAEGPVIDTILVP